MRGWSGGGDTGPREPRVPGRSRPDQCRTAPAWCVRSWEEARGVHCEQRVRGAGGRPEVGVVHAGCELTCSASDGSRACGVHAAVRDKRVWGGGGRLEGATSEERGERHPNGCQAVCRVWAGVGCRRRWSGSRDLTQPASGLECRHGWRGRGRGDQEEGLKGGGGVDSSSGLRSRPAVGRLGEKMGSERRWARREDGRG